MVIIKVFIQCKILSGATILCTCMPTQASPHKYIDYAQLTLQPTYTDGKMDLRWRRTAVWSGKKGQVYCFRKSLEVRFEEYQRGCLLERMVKIIPCKGPENGKGAGTNWNVWYKESGSWEYQKQRGEYKKVCKVDNSLSHRENTLLCMWYSYSRVCLSCGEFFVRLGASAGMQSEELVKISQNSAQYSPRSCEPCETNRKPVD